MSRVKSQKSIVKIQESRVKSQIKASELCGIQYTVQSNFLVKKVMWNVVLTNCVQDLGGEIG